MAIRKDRFWVHEDFFALYDDGLYIHIVKSWLASAVHMTICVIPVVSFTTDMTCSIQIILKITGCAVAQHFYNGVVRFLWENLELWPPVKFKPLNRLSQNLSPLIKSTRGTFVPSLVKIRSRGSSGQIGRMSLSCEIKPFDRFWHSEAMPSYPMGPAGPGPGPGPPSLRGPPNSRCVRQ